MVVLFFSKQKTEYERRSSDWSADVCSSDLCRAAGRCGFAVPGYDAHGCASVASAWMHESGRPAASTRLRLQRRHIDHEAVFHVALEHALVGGVDVLDADHFDKIGRASCRERVCQYV